MVRTSDPEKRKRFLDAALKLFVQQGFMNVSTAEIAKEAGTAAGTLFLYFPTKQDLLDEVVLRIGAEQSTAIQNLLTPALSARERFRVIWSGTLDWFQNNLDAFLYLQQVRDTGVISQAAALKSGEFFRFYYETIQKGLEEGSIKPYPLGLIGDFLYHDLVAVMNTIRRTPDQSEREAIVRQGFDIFWDGIRSGEDKE